VLSARRAQEVCIVENCY